MKEKMEKNLRLFRWLHILSELGFIGPVWMIFCLQELNLSFSLIFWFEVVCLGIMILGGLPAGALVDQIGYKRSLVIGTILLSGSMLLLALATDWKLFIISDIICMIGFLFIGPAGTALVKGSLQQMGRGDDYRRETGFIKAYLYSFLAVTSLAGGLMTIISFRLVFVWQAIWILGALVLVKFMTEPTTIARRERIDRILLQKTWQDVINQVNGVWIVVRGNGAVRAILLLCAGSMINVGFFLYTPYFIECQLPEWAYGVAFCLFNLVCLGLSLSIRWFETHFSEKWIFSVLLGSRLLTWVCMCLFSPLLGFLFILGEQFSRGLWEPFTNEFMFRHFDDDKRASAISTIGVANHIMKALVLIAIGPMLDQLAFGWTPFVLILVAIPIAGYGLRRIWQLT